MGVGGGLAGDGAMTEELGVMTRNCFLWKNRTTDPVSVYQR